MTDSDRERGYYRVMAGRGSAHAEQCRAEGFIGADFDIDESLDGKLTEELRDFNKAMIPVFLAERPDKTKIAAPHQTVEGAIIALEDDQKLRWALSAVRDVRFYRYEIKFDLHEVAIG